MHENTSRQTGTHNFILHENKVHVTKHQNKDSLYIVDLFVILIQFHSKE
ncbi:hypothetical protein C2W59_01202 [Bacillus pumilus]|nr:hypothetical protein C2W59_01202 [Bacillus pumilus]